MAAMRILHVVARSHRRGAELVALELAHELGELGVDNVVVALGLAHDGGQDPAFVPLVKSAGLSPVVFAAAAFRLRRKLKERPFDVVLAHGGWALQVAAIAVGRTGPLLVWQRILGFPPAVWGPGRHWWWRIVARRIDAAVALTDDLEDELRQLGFGGPVWVIPNSRRPERFLAVDRATEAVRLRREVGVPPDVSLIGFVGHLVDQKRPERAVDVLVRVLQDGLRAHLVMAGDGPLRRMLEREVQRRGLGDQVTLLGHRDDVEHVLGGLDLLVLTSDAEGIPGVAIEAQMAGCPVITFPLGGVAEVVEDGVTGVVLEGSSPTVMARRVSDLLRNPSQLARMGVAARARSPEFAASLTAKVYADRLLDLTRSER